MNKIPNLFVLLKERNVSRKELCSAIGVTNSNITGWKNGDYAPSIDVVIQIAHYFNVSTDYLLGRTDEITPAADSATPLTDSARGKFYEELNQLSESDLGELLVFAQFLRYKHGLS